MDGPHLSEVGGSGFFLSASITNERGTGAIAAIITIVMIKVVLMAPRR
jgi:hypothetical protein